MSNPNLFKVWSPDGSEMVETSRANARDLTTHAGWLNSPPTVVEKIVVVEVPAAAETKTETPAPVVEAAPAAETVVEEAPAAEETPVVEEAAAPAARKTEKDFDDLPEREDVVAYLAATFPEYKPHHLTRRETLIKKAIELANA